MAKEDRWEVTHDVRVKKIEPMTVGQAIVIGFVVLVLLALISQ